MTRIQVLPMFLLVLCLPSARAQTPLARAFSHLESSDASVVEAAKRSLPKVLVEEMPSIEKDEQLICDSLQSSDPYLRLQGSAILVGIVVAAPQHAVVVSTCNAALIETARDKDDDVRNNSLFALVMNPKGVTQSGHDVFIRAFGSTNLRTSELGAVGLLNETSSNGDANKKLVQDALQSASDPKIRLNLLYAIAGSHARSDGLFEAVRKSVLDTDQETAHAAIDAMAACSTSPEKLEGALGPLKSQSGVLPEIKRHAQAVIDRAGK